MFWNYSDNILLDVEYGKDGERCKKTFKELVEILEPGDIILSKKKGYLLSHLIRWIQGFRYSHAAIYIGNGLVVEAKGTKVQVGSLNHFDKDASRVCFQRIKKISKAKSQRVVAYAEDKINLRYDWVQLFIKFPIHYIKHALFKVPLDLDEVKGDPKRYICSTLVSESFASEGVDIGYHFDNVVPKMIYDSDLTETVNVR